MNIGGTKTIPQSLRSSDPALARAVAGDALGELSLGGSTLREVLLGQPRFVFVPDARGGYSVVGQTRSAELLLAGPHAGKVRQTLDGLAHLVRDRQALSTEAAHLPLAGLALSDTRQGQAANRLAGSLGQVADLRPGSDQIRAWGTDLVTQLGGNRAPASADGEWINLGSRHSRFLMAHWTTNDDGLARAAAEQAEIRFNMLRDGARGPERRMGHTPEEFREYVEAMFTPVAAARAVSTARNEFVGAVGHEVDHLVSPLPWDLLDANRAVEEAVTSASSELPGAAAEAGRRLGIPVSEGYVHGSYRTGRRVIDLALQRAGIDRGDLRARAILLGTRSDRVPAVLAREIGRREALGTTAEVAVARTIRADVEVALGA